MAELVIVIEQNLTLPNLTNLASPFLTLPTDILPAAPNPDTC